MENKRILLIDEKNKIIIINPTENDEKVFAGSKIYRGGFIIIDRGDEE